MDRRRLERLVEAGDREAARVLWNEARRRGDRSVAVRAAAALDDAEALCELVLEAWTARDWSVTEEASGVLGLVLDEAACRAVDEALERVHGRRRLRLLSRGQVVRTLVAARLARSYATAHGGAPEGRGDTTLCLAVVRDDESCVLGLGRASGTTPSDVADWREVLGSWSLSDKLERCVNWAQGAPAVDRLVIGLRPVCTEARRLRRDVAPAERQLARLTAVEADDEVYRALVELVERWPRAAGRAEVEARAAQALGRFPLERRSLLERDTGAGLLATTPALHPLQAHLTVELPTDLGAIADLPRFDALRSLEIVERTGRTLAGQPEALHDFLERSAMVDRLDRLSLRLSSPAMLQVVARCPRLLSRLRTLVVWCGDSLDLARARLYAAIFESCTSLERFELVHRSRLSALIPALKRVRRVGELRLALGRIGYARLEQALTNLGRAAPSWLDMQGTDLSGGALSVLGHAPALAGLQGLVVANTHASHGDFGWLGEASFAGTLEHLELSGNALGDAATLQQLHAFGSLRSLALAGCGLDATTLDALLRDAPWRLEALDLRRNALGASAGALLADAPALESLESLELAVTELDAGAADVLSAPFVQTLRALDLRGARGGDTWLAALGSGARPERLEHLDLGRCELSWRGVETLTSVEGLQPQTLRLDRNPLQARGLRTLAAWPALAGIARLDLTQTRGGTSARAVLEDSPWLRGLVAGVEGVEGAVAWRR